MFKHMLRSASYRQTFYPTKNKHLRLARFLKKKTYEFIALLTRRCQRVHTHGFWRDSVRQLKNQTCGLTSIKVPEQKSMFKNRVYLLKGKSIMQNMKGHRNNLNYGLRTPNVWIQPNPACSSPWSILRISHLNMDRLNQSNLYAHGSVYTRET